MKPKPRHDIQDHVDSITTALWSAYEPKLQAAYKAVLMEMAETAAKNFERLARKRPPLAAAGNQEPPSWRMPDGRDVLPGGSYQDKVDAASGDLRKAIVYGTAAGVAGKYGMALDLSNPLLSGAIKQLGQKITGVVEESRAEIMASVQEGYDKGLSIPNTMKLITDNSEIDSDTRARAIARTELTSGTNIGSLAAARLVDAASPATSMLKGWLSAEDDVVRPAHQDADSEYSDSGIPLDQPFSVDGEDMQHPGDPDGSPGNVINCRCTLVYLQGNGSSSTLGGVGDAGAEAAPLAVEDVAGADADAIATAGPPVPGVPSVPGLADRERIGEGIRGDMPLMIGGENLGVPNDVALRSTRAIKPGAALPSKVAFHEGYQHAGGHLVAVEIPGSPFQVNVFVEKGGLNEELALRSGRWTQDEIDQFYKDRAELTARISGAQMAKLPREMQKQVKGIAFAQEKNPSDAHWAEAYGDPGFLSAATGDWDSGTISVWNQADKPQPFVSFGTLRHEAAHVIGGPGETFGDAGRLSQRDVEAMAKFLQVPYEVEPDGSVVVASSATGPEKKRWVSWRMWNGGGPKGDRQGLAWVRAAIKDNAEGMSRQEIRSALLGQDYWEHFGVTPYGANAAVEDWAESNRLYLYALAHDGALPNTNATFEVMWPARARILAKKWGPLPGRSGYGIGRVRRPSADVPPSLRARRVVLHDLDDGSRSVSRRYRVAAAGQVAPVRINPVGGEFGR